jgi:transposase InsO family protein
MTCAPGPPSGRIRVHLELFADRRVVVIPEHVGVRQGCRYPLRTLTPTGVIELDRPEHTLGDFFAVWRMPLARKRLLTFRGTVTAYVAGRRWQGDVTEIPLRDHGQIVVEIGGYIPPHRFYLFPPR